MPRYLITWKANASAWPVDPQQSRALLEASFAGGDQLVASGAIKDIGLFTPQEGFGIFEADSKAAVLAMAAPFFPLYTQEVHEIVPWEDGKKAILARPVS